MLIGMMIVDELDFNFVEGERFHAFCNTLQPKIFIPSHVTMAKDCYQLYSSEKKIEKCFNKSVSKGLL